MSNRSVAITENKFTPMKIRLGLEHELVASATSRKRADSLGTTPSEEKRNRGTDIADSPRSRSMDPLMCRSYLSITNALLLCPTTSGQQHSRLHGKKWVASLYVKAASYHVFPFKPEAVARKGVSQHSNAHIISPTGGESPKKYAEVCRCGWRFCLVLTNELGPVAVSAVVALTALLLFITTIAPARFALRTSHAAFVPFRSPQSWMFLRVFRGIYPFLSRLERLHWIPYEIRILGSNWADFDLQFLQWHDEHSTATSIHRMFHWVLHTLGGSNNVEKAAFWCLQTPESHPPKLVKSQEELLRYGLGGGSPNTNTDAALYSYSTIRHGYQDIGTDLGQYQVELLLRSIHQYIADTDQETSKPSLKHFIF